MAGADIYWVAGPTGTRIGRAADDGTGVNRRFITGPNEVGGLAVGVGYIYWSHGSSIGRARLDGSSVERTFIRGLGAINGITVDRRFIYWLSVNNPACAGKPGFGRAALDGRRITRGFVCSAKHRRPIADDGYANGIAVSGDHLYWSWFAGIGRAATDRRSTRYDNTFITLPRGDSAAGVAASDSHIYWGSYTPGPPVGRADLTGVRANARFIDGVSGDVGPEVALSNRYLYFTNDYSSGWTIARATLDGVVSWDFISGLDAVGALAVGP